MSIETVIANLKRALSCAKHEDLLDKAEIAACIAYLDERQSRERSFAELRDVLGYVENGGHTAVKIYQDDATRSWCMDVCSKHYYADSLSAVIRNAHAIHHELIEPQD